MPEPILHPVRGSRLRLVAPPATRIEARPSHAVEQCNHGRWELRRTQRGRERSCVSDLAGAARAKEPVQVLFDRTITLSRLLLHCPKCSEFTLNIDEVDHLLASEGAYELILEIIHTNEHTVAGQCPVEESPFSPITQTNDAQHMGFGGVAPNERTDIRRPAHCHYLDLVKVSSKNASRLKYCQPIRLALDKHDCLGNRSRPHAASLSHPGTLHGQIWRI